jgi:hypothetical protein
MYVYTFLPISLKGILNRTVTSEAEEAENAAECKVG